MHAGTWGLNVACLFTFVFCFFLGVMAAGRTRSTRKLRSWIVEQVRACVRACVCGRDAQTKEKIEADAIIELKGYVQKEN